MEQDLFEDYINTHRNTEPKEEKTKIQSIINTSEKKKQCEENAIKIVQLLMEGCIRRETFLKSIVYLNSMYYQDVVEERAITRICGYPLCGKRIGTMPKKRYTISTKNNKIYDLNEYGFFCSIFCHNASHFIKNQIDDSPLWLREFENMPSLNLLSRDTVQSQSSNGVNLKQKHVTEEVKSFFTPIASFAEISLVDLDNRKNRKGGENENFNLSAVVIKEKKDLGLTHDSRKQKTSKLESIVEETSKNAIIKDYKRESTTVENYLLNSNNIGEDNSSVGQNQYLVKTKHVSVHENIANDKRNDMMQKDSGLSSKECSMKTEAISADHSKVNNNKKYILKEGIEDVNGKLSNPVLKCKDPSSVPKVKEVGSKTKDLKAIAEKIKKKCSPIKLKVIDPLPMKNSVRENDSLINVELNPLKENHLKLKDKSLLELKFSLKNSIEVENQVRSAIRNWISLDTLMHIHGEDKIKDLLDENELSVYFEKLKIAQSEITQQKRYSDICRKLQMQELLEEKWDKCNGNKLQPLPDYNELKEKNKELDIKVKSFYGGMLYEAEDKNFIVKDTKEKEDEDVPAVLPLVDVSSQNALRRRVLLNSLNKSVEFITNQFEYNSATTFTDLQDLVKTFKLSANNVVFKAKVWNYLGLICIMILALKDDKLKNALEQEDAQKMQSVMWEQLPSKKCVAGECLKLVNDVDSFITNYIMMPDA